MRIQDIVSRDPEVMSGALVFAGTRVPVRILTEHLEAGDPLNVFLEDFPTVTRRQAKEYLRLAERLIEYQVGEEPVEERVVPVGEKDRRERAPEHDAPSSGTEEEKEHARAA